MLKKIDRILLRVPQLESAVRYYRDVVGLELLKQDARLASFRLAESGELVLHNDPDLPFEQVYYLVDNVRDLYTRREAMRLTFVSKPRQASRGFTATVKDPFGNVLQILDRTTESAASTQVVEDTKSADGLFAGVETRSPVQKDRLVAAYEKVGRTADDLPYTPHFETFYDAYCGSHAPRPSRGEAWRHLLNLRKGGKLPKLGEAKSKPPTVTPEARQQLRNMLGADIGKRDRLPYTQRFDQLVDEFNRTQPRPLSPHLVWRLVATLAK